MKKLFLAALILISNLALAQMPDLTKDSYVNDFAHVLTSDQIDVLNQRIAEIEKKASLQLIIVLVDKLPQSMDADDMITAVDEKWQEGNYNINYDRLVYVAAIGQAHHKLVASRGIKSLQLFNGQKCDEILSAMRPYYNQKDYNGGLEVLVSTVGAALNVNFQPLPQDNTQNSLYLSKPFIVTLVIAALGILIILLLWNRSRKKVYS